MAAQQNTEYFESQGVYCIPTPTPFPVGAANVYLHKGDCLTLFDTGTNTDAAWQVFTDQLQELGIELRDIERIILTHHHLDHIGLSCRIKQASNATIYAHPDVPVQIPYMFDEVSVRLYIKSTLRELGVPDGVAERLIALRHMHREFLDDFMVDTIIADHESIGDYTVCFRSGHSDTDTLFVHSEERWVITGDHLIKNVTPNPLLRRPSNSGIREKSLVQYVDALQKTRSLELDWCFPGHGPAFRDHRSVVDSTLRHIERRGEKIAQVIPAGGATPYEVSSLVFSNISAPQVYYCLSATTGHLELLETKGMLTCAKEEGILRYKHAVSV